MGDATETEAADFSFERKRVRFGEHTLSYVDAGAGPPLLMLHAAPTWSFVYREFVRALSPRFRCIAPDFPGWGCSPAGTHGELSLDGLAEVIAGLIEALDLRDLIVLVHDASGPPGLYAASRLHTRVAGLIITDTFAWPLRPYLVVRPVLRLVGSRVFGMLADRFALLPRVVSRIAPMRRRLTIGERRAYRLAFATRESHARVRRLLRALGTDEDFLARVERALAGLADTPALVLYGQFDPARLLGWQRRFLAYLPRSSPSTIWGEGHFPHEGAPQDMIRAILDWAEREQLIPVGASP